MIRRFTHFILTASLSAFMGSLTLSAQDQVEKANIPFDFNSQGKVLPAGEYQVRESGSDGLFQLYDSKGHAGFVLMHPENEGTVGNPRLVFRCYGEERILTQIWKDDGTGYAVSNSTVEKALHRKLEMATLISVKLTPR